MKIKSGFILREIAGNYIVVSVGERVKEFNGVVNLNKTGVLLWNALIKGATEEELVNALLSEYDVEKSVAESDVLEFVNKLKEANLIKD
ncbi:MAG: PqqD family protein [Clostridia bacterium]|nr:PqqD family protein [Clostridia bacterium]